MRGACVLVLVRDYIYCWQNTNYQFFVCSLDPERIWEVEWNLEHTYFVKPLLVSHEKKWLIMRFGLAVAFRISSNAMKNFGHF